MKRGKIMFTRDESNPIVTPGKYSWRKAAVFNPAVIYDNGKFYMLERAAGTLRPFNCALGLLESDDGIHFKHVKDQPVMTGALLGMPYASIQDPRLVKIEGKYYLNYAVRPYANNCSPTGLGVPEYSSHHYPGWDGDFETNITRSGIAVSEDLIHWDQIAFTTPAGVDDRDNVLFPEKINGKYVLLRRPLSYVGEKYGTNSPAMWISYSDNLLEWTEPKLLAVAKYEWEGGKIGASTPPLKTEKGWLVLYHGVDADSVYRVGSMLLDLQNPEKILGRTKDFIMEPEEYYEKIGLVIPNVVFPTGNIIKDGLLYIYYGCCDTSIGLATVPLDRLIESMNL